MIMEEKKYFYSDGTNRFGPFTFDELKAKNIKRDTYVWYSGLTQWEQASNLAELDELFHLVPPAFDKNRTSVTNNEQETGPKPPRTWLLESILVTLFCCLPFGIVGIVYAAKVDSAYTRGAFSDATRYSKQAGKWTRIGFWLGLSVGIIYIIIAMFGATLSILQQ